MDLVICSKPSTVAIFIMYFFLLLPAEALRYRIRVTADETIEWQFEKVKIFLIRYNDKIAY